MERRVVITGLGAITPIGNNVEEFWNGIKEGKCGIDKITHFDTENFKVKLAAEVKGYNPEEHFDRRETKRIGKFSQFAIVAAREAVKDANIDVNKIDAERFGVAISTGIGALDTIEEQVTTYINKGIWQQEMYQ